MDSQNWKKNYFIHQINGTIFVRTTKMLPPQHLSMLECGAGELFLSRISKQTTVDKIMQEAIQLGDVFMLRFKVDFSGKARGYAYLQYIELYNMQRALNVLQHCFRLIKLKIQVRQSKNLKKLLLSNVNHMTPMQVYEHLRYIWRYVKLTVFEYYPYHYSYIIEYRNNDEAAIAHNILKSKPNNFGPEAVITWLEKGRDGRDAAIPDFEAPSTCCVPLQQQIISMESQCFVAQVRNQQFYFEETQTTTGYVQNQIAAANFF